MSDYAQRDLLVAADRVREMAATHGWGELARWVTEQVELDRQAIERGLGSFDEYQRTVGRIEAYRKVIGRPEEVVALAAEAIRGDDHG